ncbi:hypothetical protein CK203_058556 [Vitis vinifera]|uniref:RIN4 pathogenic type III effector avirulence factor Avr cleavage site domain-containing protein n=1 Tax=Vitis vinifera TaxID=29760 RepID=A0A438G9T3_VITVI|nr:hypothetical protein CK203_058556 [Vitis vinifera]
MVYVLIVFFLHPTQVLFVDDKGRPLPKFGEWDVNNPASAEGFTVIFSKARDEKKTNGAAAGGGGAQNIDNHKQDPNFPDTPLVFTILILESSKRGGSAVFETLAQFQDRQML